MHKHLIAAVLLSSFATSVLAAEAFYIVFDATLRGCTIETAESLPTRPVTKSWAPTHRRPEAEEAIATMKECSAARPALETKSTAMKLTSLSLPTGILSGSSSQCAEAAAEETRKCEMWR